MDDRNGFYPNVNNSRAEIFNNNDKKMVFLAYPLRPEYN